MNKPQDTEVDGIRGIIGLPCEKTKQSKQMIHLKPLNRKIRKECIEARRVRQQIRDEIEYLKFFGE